MTVTPSAAIDQTYLLPLLQPGAVNRAVQTHRELSGKGVNVARAVALTDTAVSAVLAVGDDDARFVAGLDFNDILRVVSMPGTTRVNTTVVDENGQTTKINQRPIPLTRVVWKAVCEASAAELDRIDADWLVVCGSVPALAETGELVSFDDLVADAASRGVRVAVDTSGAALKRLADDFDGIAVIKPNTHELAEVVERALRTVGDVINAAQSLRDRGCEVVYVSMGGDGAIAVSGEGVWWARATPSANINTTGAGDASLAGFLVHADSHKNTTGSARVDVPAALAGAASWGALAISQPTTLLNTVAGAPVAQLVESPDPTQKLTDTAG